MIYVIENKTTLSVERWDSLGDQAISLGRRPKVHMLPGERRKFIEMVKLGITEVEPYGMGKVLRIE